MVERLHLRFLADGSYVVDAAVEIAAAQESGNPALARRLDELRRALEGGWDDWARRFAVLDAPPAERAVVEKLEGEVHRVARAAYLEEPARLGAFFADTALQVHYARFAEHAELAIVPGLPGRATRRQRQAVERALEEWSAEVAAYLAAAGDLYAYFDRRPDRATACLGSVFADLLDASQVEALPELDEEEAALVERLETAMGEVVEVLLVPSDGPRSLDELSRLVFDPFPARLVVTAPSPPLEVVGFQVAAPSGPLRVPGFGLWDALRGLEGRWLTPDPAGAYVAHRGDRRGSRFDLDAFAARARSVAPAPDAAEIAAALRRGLEPAPVYRASWRIDPEAEVEAPW